jgi:small subunit ribosomal protein S16
MVKIRLARRGRKKLAIYDVVIANSKSPRDGRFIEKIGTYDPNHRPALIKIDEDRAFYWLMVGAQPTDTVKAMLSYKGVSYRKHLQVGVNKGAITQEVADSKLAAWKQAKEAKVQGRVDGLVKTKIDAKKAALAAETKVKEAKAEAIKKKNEVVVEAVAPEVTPAAEENTES